jgi:hypothetical protein
MSELNLVAVDFHGDTLEAVQDAGGAVWASLRRMCEGVGIDESKQRRKLKNKPWATTDLKSAVAQDGKRRELMMVHLDTIPMWLATIEPSKVKPEVRPKLERYQKEAARVLAEHFLPKPRAEVVPKASGGLAAIRVLNNQVGALIDELEGHEQRLGVVEQQVGLVGRQVGALVAGQKAARQALLEVERSDKIAKPMELRDKIRRLVNRYCEATASDQGDAWPKLYEQMYYRHKVNLTLRTARAAGCKSILGMVERLGLLEELFAIASEIFKLPPANEPREPEPADPFLGEVG